MANTRSAPSIKSNLKKGGRTGLKVSSGSKGSAKKNAMPKGMASKGGMKPTKAAGAPKSGKSPFGKIGTTGTGSKPQQNLWPNMLSKSSRQNKRDTGMSLLAKAMGKQKPGM